MVLECLVHELVDLVWNLFLFVEQDLFLVVLPVESEVLDSNTVPVVCKLHSCCVYYSLDLVGNDKLKVLSSVFVADEEAIFNFDHSNHIFIFSFVFNWGLIRLNLKNGQFLKRIICE